MTVPVDLRRQLTARRGAQVAIVIEIAVIARSLGEIYRLRLERGATFTLDEAMAWVAGALIALAFLLVSTLLYFAARERLSIASGIAMVVALIAYKAVAIGLG